MAVDVRGFDFGPSVFDVLRKRTADRSVLQSQELSRNALAQQIAQRQAEQAFTAGQRQEVAGLAAAARGAPQAGAPLLGQPAAADGVAAQPAPQPTFDQRMSAILISQPEKAKQITESLGLDTQAKKDEFADFAFRLKNTPFDQRDQLINERVVNLEAQGRDATQTKGLSGQTEEMQNQNLTSGQLASLSVKERMDFATGIGRGAGLKQFAPVTLVNESTGEKRIAIPTADPRTGAARLEPADFPQGFQIAKETPEEKRSADIIAAEQKKAREVTGKSLAERRARAIDSGLDAADGMANLRRASQLLEQVKTGGIDAVSLSAKQLFGVEGEDEAELSNRLGKAVLSQLRATFGAAFTAKEGESLSKIEAGFGKSTEGNRRLINQTIKIVERAAERGIRAAERIGDTDSANEIRNALEFRLDEESAGGQQVGRFQVEVVQ